jgi:formylglycine-generating enzyme required for sulfatase activity
MAGNVWEWVNDWYVAYPSTAQTNPTGPETGDYKVLRGGAGTLDADRVRSAYRGWGDPDHASSGDGFRCVGASTP